MRRSLMDRAPDGQVDVILTHPRHQLALQTLIGLVRDLRRAHGAADLYEFQERLFGLVWEVEERRAAIIRVVKRLKKPGGTVPPDAPELGTGLDPSDLDSWLLEDEVFERIWRQYKSIADALAWRAFGYDRRIIVALSRNDRPGLMYGKDGVTQERVFIEAAWREHGEFVLHHDLTTALRVGDVTVLHSDGTAQVYEVKTNQSHRIKKQDQLVLDTSTVLANEEGALPSGFTPIRTSIRFRTDLRGLRELLGLAHERTGIQGGIVSPGRAVVAASQYTATGHYRAEEFSDRLATDVDRYQRKIGIRSPAHRLTLTSLDSVARWPVRPPWAIYPLAPEVAASLIADGMFFFVSMSPDGIVDRLSEVGVRAEWLQRLDGSEDWAKPLLRVGVINGDRMLFTSLNPEAIAGLMLEFIDLRTWCCQVATVLRKDMPIGTRPWPCFTDEDRTWA